MENDQVMAPEHDKPVNLEELKIFLDAMYRFAESNQEAVYATFQMSQVPTEVLSGSGMGAHQMMCEGNRTFTVVLQERRPKHWYIAKFIGNSK